MWACATTARWFGGIGALGVLRDRADTAAIVGASAPSRRRLPSGSLASELRQSESDPTWHHDPARGYPRFKSSRPDHNPKLEARVARVVTSERPRSSLASC